MRVPGIRARRVDLADSDRVEDNVTIDVRDAASGRLLERITTHNLVVDAGLSLLAARLEPDAVQGLTHFGVGTSSTAPAAGDTALGAQVHRDVITQYIPGLKKMTVRYYLSTASANGYTLRECGTFNAASGGTMYARAAHADIVKTSAKTVTYSWDYNMAAV